jgi:hypothetical protein
LKTNKNGQYDKVASHHISHFDEYVGASFMFNFGEDVFPGARKILQNKRFEFLVEEPESAVPGTIYIGIGGERLGEFDEHRTNGPRLQNTCATTLVTRRLGICDKPGVHELAGEVLWCDTKPKVFPTQLATLVKVAHRVKITSSQFGTFLWANDAINSVVFNRSFDDSYDIRRAWRNFRKDEHVPEIEDLERFISAAHGRRETFVTELAGICARMRPDLRQKWLPVTFRMIVKDAELFRQAVEEVNTKSETVDIQTDTGSQPMMLIASDNEQIVRAASSVKTGKAAITVIRSTAGLTAIMCDHEQGIDLNNLAVMIRMAEYRKCTKQRLSFKKAAGEGTVVACPQWHLANKNLLLNGSLSHPLVTPSKLSLGEIKEIASRAFMATQREAWFLNYHEGPSVVTLPEKDSEELVLT